MISTVFHKSFYPITTFISLRSDPLKLLALLQPWSLDPPLEDVCIVQWGYGQFISLVDLPCTSRASQGFDLILTTAHCTCCSIQATKPISCFKAAKPLQEGQEQVFKSHLRNTRVPLHASPVSPWTFPRFTTHHHPHHVLMRDHICWCWGVNQGHRRAIKWWAHLSRSHSRGCAAPANSLCVLYGASCFHQCMRSDSRWG